MLRGQFGIIITLGGHSEGHHGWSTLGFSGYSEYSGFPGDSGNCGAPGGSGDAGNSGNSGDSGASASILGPIFVVFRGYIARATRLAARRAEPSFLLAGAALSRVRRLCRKFKNTQKSKKNHDDAVSRTRLARTT